MNPTERIKLHQPDFTPSDKKVAAYVLDRLDVIASFTITDAASRIGVSKSALLRFCKKIGYQGYAEFRFDAAHHLLSGTNDGSTCNDSHQFIDNYVSCVTRIPNTIVEHEVENLINSILGATSIKIFGVHESGLSGKYLSYRLAALNINSEALTSTETFNTKAALSKPEDLNIFVSVSGITPNIISAFQESKKSGATCALITTNELCPLAKESDLLILIPSFSIDRSALFLDSQAIMLIAIDLIINRLAVRLCK